MRPDIATEAIANIVPGQAIIAHCVWSLRKAGLGALTPLSR
jgi:hypothetical protein